MESETKVIEEILDVPAPFKKPKRKYTPRKAKAKPAIVAKPTPKPDEPVAKQVIDEGIFAGITDVKCPDACNLQRCVISTVNVCKHPIGHGVSGCGPITLANRAAALKVLKLKKLVKEDT